MERMAVLESCWKITEGVGKIFVGFVTFTVEDPQSTNQSYLVKRVSSKVHPRQRMTQS